MSTKHSIKKEIIVNAPQERAFRVFTEEFDTWWPRTHSISKVPMKKSIIEPKIGGRWYEIGEDSSECSWGTVLAYDPPKRLLLTWQLTHDWKFDPNFVTEVEVNFEALGKNRTRVTLEHRNLDRFGDNEQTVSTMFDSDGGWTGLLALFGSKAGDSV